MGPAVILPDRMSLLRLGGPQYDWPTQALHTDIFTIYYILFTEGATVAILRQV